MHWKEITHLQELFLVSGEVGGKLLDTNLITSIHFSFFAFVSSKYYPKLEETQRDRRERMDLKKGEYEGRGSQLPRLRYVPFLWSDYKLEADQQIRARSRIKILTSVYYCICSGFQIKFFYPLLLLLLSFIYLLLLLSTFFIFSIKLLEFFHSHYI